MERKVGEIFEYNGEWYQCVEGTGCYKCAFYDKNICIANNPHCTCRSDKKNVIFKKLEKVGEPEIINGKKVQSIVTGYVGCAFCILKKGGACLSGGTCKNRFTRIYVEIKQNKEDMEENKTTVPKEDNALTMTVYAYVNGKISDKELIKSIKEMSDEYPYNKNSLKPFSLEAAKTGKPVCTRDGRKARIICFDLNNKNFPIVAIINCDTEENAYQYDIDGVCDEHDNNLNLMMLPQKKEGWVNIYTSFDGVETGIDVYETEEIAKKNVDNSTSYLGTIKIEWEE